MIVSLATMTLGYPGAAKFLICFSLASLFIEYFWLAVVYEQFPILKRADVTRAKLHSERQEEARRHQLALSAKATNGTRGFFNLFSIVTRRCAEVKAAVGDDIAMWKEFANMPVSLSKSSEWLATGRQRLMAYSLFGPITDLANEFALWSVKRSISSLSILTLWARRCGRGALQDVGGIL